ncbi:MAG: transpeptidase family protein [Crocinitomicaceae bacterium]|nr:transpeptidase family protein [Crocinitomicaceae bacterium]
MSERKDIFWRSYLVYFGFAVLMLVALIKTIAIQMDNGGKVFMSSANGEERMPTRVVLKKPRLGQILDANYKPLVTSVSYYDIHMDPTVVDEELFNSKVSDLSVALNDLFPDQTAKEFLDVMRKGRADSSQYVLIRRKVTNDQRKKIGQMPIFEKGRFKGGLLDNEETIDRKRPHGELMKRTLGYVKKLGNGEELRVGLEGAYIDYLRGVPGEEVEQKISTGWKKIGPVTKEPVEGANIVTTIDKEIQEVAHSELLNQLVDQGARNGCVIVMDVKTGYVKAIANLVKNKDGNYYEAYNHAIGTKEVPGSTFKLASLMALLEDGKVTLEDEVNAVGKYEFYDRALHDSRKWGYGKISIQSAFEKSSNVLAKVVHAAYKDEPQAFVDRLKSFGLADPLGIEIKGEPIPTVYEPGMSNWSGISLPWMAVGYEVQQTPLQTLAFYNAVANDGKFLKPQFVREIRRGNQVVESFDPVVLKERVCSDKTVKDLQKCLKGVVQRGTGSALKSAYFDIAGKTGTARILNDDMRYGEVGEQKYLASFAGYFPADNPIYSCIVVISAPSKDIYGAVVSGTVFNAIANKVYASSFQYHDPVNVKKNKVKSIPRVRVGSQKDLVELLGEFDVPFVVDASTEYSVVRKKDGKAIVENRFIGKDTVPNVIGMTAKDAVYLIESCGMGVRIEGVGKVVSQSIRPGVEVSKGVVIKIGLK